MEPLVAEIERRFAELEAQLGDPAVLADQRRYAGVAREHKRLSAAAELARQWRERTTQVADAAELANDPDEDMRAFAQEQVLEAREALPALEEEIRLAMLERDPADDKDVIVELRAGTGGDEAASSPAICTGCSRAMPSGAGGRSTRWRRPGPMGVASRSSCSSSPATASTHSSSTRSGVHRVQRVPATETQGRIHTSTATVAVLPEAEDVECTSIRRTSDRRSARGGPGGQGVNTTNSAVRIPTSRPG